MARPFILDPLFKSLTTLPGMGPKLAALAEKLVGGGRIADALFHKPVDCIDRRFAPKVADAPAGKVATIEVTIDDHQAGKHRNQPYRIKCSDETGTLTLVFFRPNKGWLEKQFPLGEKRIVSGMVEHYAGNPQMVHPDKIGTVEERQEIETIEPIYPLTAGLTNKALSKAIHGALKITPDLPEWLDAALLKREQWPSWKNALTAIHQPQTGLNDQMFQNAVERLAYDELLANQLTLSLVRLQNRKKKGRAFSPSQNLRPQLLEQLPFALTGAQQRSLNEIDEDMASPYRMMRLLQGDVGSGKTIVAALAMCNAVEAGSQAAMMAPTEILARQHAATLKPLLDKIGIRHVTLTGRDKGKTRETLLAQIRNGAAQIIFGTHAIFQEAIEFADLGLAIVDEQHRFGVHQRMALSDKGKGTDILAMTATPIPRTLTMATYGNMDISRLDEKPPGRKPIDTRLINLDSIEELIHSLKSQIKTGARIYWVCPLVEESEVMDLQAAEDRYDILKTMFDRIGLIHGRMKPAEKDAVMQQFADGELDILVSTTVIEVGVNVPEATIMVIEHAERFGLSQLHQLRGRVGRGGDKSYCFLLYKTPLSETAKQRLAVMRDSEDGFFIAEKDLELRGAGDILGTQQSGLPVFKFADLEAHIDLLKIAHDDARLITEKDPKFKTDRGEALRTLLYLHRRDQAIAYLSEG